MRRALADTVARRLQALGQHTTLAFDSPHGYQIWARGADWQAPSCVRTGREAEALVRRLRGKGKR